MDEQITNALIEEKIQKKFGDLLTHVPLKVGKKSGINQIIFDLLTRLKILVRYDNKNEGSYINAGRIRTIIFNITRNIHRAEIIENIEPGTAIFSFLDIGNPEGLDIRNQNIKIGNINYRFIRLDGVVYAIPAIYIQNNTIMDERSIILTLIGELRYFINRLQQQPDPDIERRRRKYKEKTKSARTNLVPTTGQADPAPPDANQQLLDETKEIDIQDIITTTSEGVLDEALNEYQTKPDLDEVDKALLDEINLDEEQPTPVVNPIQANVQILQPQLQPQLEQLEREIELRAFIATEGVHPDLFKQRDEPEEPKKSGIKKKFLDIINNLKSINRGPDNIGDGNINNQPIDENLINQIISEDLRIFLKASIVAGAVLGVTYLKPYNIYRQIYANILDLLGYTYNPNVVIQAEKIQIVTDKVGNIIEESYLGRSTIQPKAISAQSSNSIVFNLDRYTVMRNFTIVQDTDLKFTFSNQVDDYADSVLQIFTNTNKSFSSNQITYDFKDMENVSKTLLELTNNLFETGKIDEDIENRYIEIYNKFLNDNRPYITNFLEQNYNPISNDPDDPDDPYDDDEDYDFGHNDEFGHNKKFGHNSDFKHDMKDDEKQWFIMKSVIYWFVNPIKEYYGLLSDRTKYVAFIAFQTAVSWIENLSIKGKLLFFVSSAGAFLYPKETIKLVDKIFRTGFSIAGNVIDLVENVSSVVASPVGLFLIVGVIALVALSKIVN